MKKNEDCYRNCRSNMNRTNVWVARVHQTLGRRLENKNLGANSYFLDSHRWYLSIKARELVKSVGVKINRIESIMVFLSPTSLMRKWMESISVFLGQFKVLSSFIHMLLYKNRNTHVTPCYSTKIEKHLINPNKQSS